VGIRDVNQGIGEEEGIAQMVQTSPHVSMRRAAGRLHVPQTRVWRTPWRGHVSIPRAANATSQTWRFCSGAGILRVAQWQSLVASLHPVY
jgi:hypothetical protein